MKFSKPKYRKMYYALSKSKGKLYAEAFVLNKMLNDIDKQNLKFKIFLEEKEYPFYEIGDYKIVFDTKPIRLNKNVISSGQIKDIENKPFEQELIYKVINKFKIKVSPEQYFYIYKE